LASSSSSSVPSTPSPTPILDPWIYVGCANDSIPPNPRALNGSTLTNDLMTVDMCKAHCSSKNYPLAGLEAVTQCFCGLDLSTAGSFSYGQTGCNRTCGGGDGNTCGGSRRLDVYRNTSYVMPEVVQSIRNPTTGVQLASLKGCYNDSTRLLTGYKWTPGNVTVQSCYNTCTTQRFSVSGVQFGGECYCGNAVPDSSALAPGGVWDCRAMFCNGNQTQFCGGSRRMLVYGP